MRRRSLLLLLTVLALGLGFPRTAGANEVDDHLVRIEKLQAQRDRLDGERRGLEQQLEAKTGEIARLKKQRGSWSGKDKLNKRLAEAKDLAGKLDAKAVELRKLDGDLRKERQALVKAIDRELAAMPAPAPARKARLDKLRADTGKRLGGGKPIKVVDEDMSPLDDPEDLDEKAAHLEEGEASLRAEEKRLDRRATYYKKQAKLQRAKQRAKEGDVFDDNPRRGNGGNPGGRGGQTASVGGEDDTTGGAGAAPPPADPGNFDGVDAEASPLAGGGGGGAEAELGGDPSVIYADVVDPETLAEMEKAERTGDPEAKAKAAERARDDVKKRADRLRAKRLQMEKRAKELREQGE